MRQSRMEKLRAGGARFLAAGRGALTGEIRPVVLTIVTVATTLFVGLVGVLIHTSTRDASEAFAAAQRADSEASQLLITQRQQADADYLAYQRAASDELAASVAAVTARTTASREIAVAAWGRAVAASNAARQATLPADFSEGRPTDDPTFPDNVLATRLLPAQRVAAVQDAAQRAGAAASTRSSSLSAIVTVCAVALFLLGAAGALGGRSRTTAFWIGGALVVGSVGAALRVEAGAAAADRPAVAEDYGEGLAALGAAASAIGQEAATHAADAIAALTRAIDARPAFAGAWLARGQAHLAAGARERGAVLIPTDIDERHLAAAVADLRHAVALGRHDPQVLATLATLETLSWLAGRAGTAPAAAALAASLAANPASTVTHGELGAMAVGTGDAAGAQRSFAAQAAALDALRAQQIPDFAAYAEQVIAHTLTLVARAPGGDETALERVVSALVPHTEPVGQPAASVSPAHLSPTIDVQPGVATVSFDGAALGTDVTGRRISVQWWSRPSADGPWAVVPSLSGWSGTAAEIAAGQAQLVPRRTGTTVSLSGWMSGRACLGDGEYRADVYVDGQRAGSVTSAVNGLREMRQADERAVGARLCVPADWQRAAALTLPAPDGTPVLLSGVAVVYSSPQPAGEEAVAIMRLPLAADMAARAGSDSVRRQLAAELAIKLLGEAGAPGIGGALHFRSALTSPTPDVFLARYDGDGRSAIVEVRSEPGEHEQVALAVVAPTATVEAMMRAEPGVTIAQVFAAARIAGDYLRSGSGAA